MKVALVHDYLIQDGGAERTVLALHELYPEAPIYTLFYDPVRSHPAFRKIDVRPSSLNTLPFAQRHYEWYLPLMSHAIEMIDLSGYDLVISSSSSFAKGVFAAPHAVHVCYCHTPTRFLWQERLGYVNELPRPRIIKKILPPFLHHLRQWDRMAAERPDRLITNSKTSQERIQRYYRRSSQVIHPPVDTHLFSKANHEGLYWLAAGRLVAYKKFDRVVQAFAELNLPLKVFGTGPDEKKLRAMAGPNTEILGCVDEETKIELYQHAIAFLHPQVEDFGITAVEAMAAGKPVLALGKGGARETVVPGVTGEFLFSQEVDDIQAAVRAFDPHRYATDQIRAHAERFSKERFQREMREVVEHALQQRPL